MRHHSLLFAFAPLFGDVLRNPNAMNLNVNQKPVELLNGRSLADLSQQLQLPKAGIAMAVNGTIVPMSRWDSYLLSPADNVTVIKATCGG